MLRSIESFIALLNARSSLTWYSRNCPGIKYQIEADLRDVIKEIRQEKDFEDLLLLPICHKQILKFGSQRPIVFLIGGIGAKRGVCSGHICYNDERDGLPHFSDDACRHQYAPLKRALESRDETPGANGILYDVLKWLLYNGSEPVLRALGLLHTNAEGSKVRR